MEQKYPTREQAESIASNDCAHEICRTCDIEKWCAGDRVETIGAISASRRCGMSMLAMHDEIDRLVDALDGMRFAYANGDPDFPHQFEEDAYRKATEVLNQYGKPWTTWDELQNMRGRGIRQPDTPLPIERAAQQGREG